MSDLKSAAKNVIDNCFSVKKGERVLIVIDETTRNIGYALWDEAKNAGAESMILEMMPREVNGQEPPFLIAEAMKHANVVIMPTAKSLSHTKARRDANEAGARMATMPGITEDMMIRTLNADYMGISTISLKLSERLKGTKSIHLTTPLGTDVTLSVDGRYFEPDTGIIEEKGFSNLPAGEVYAAPVEGTTNGIVYIDGSMAGIGLIDGEPIKIIIEDGYAVKIEGGEQANKLFEMLNKVGHDAFNVAELGIGTNDMAKLTGRVLEDEKIKGTVHMAFGNNKSFGGYVDVPIHLDGVITKPTLVVDGIKIMEDGILKI